MGSQGDQLVEKIVDLYQKLSVLDSLKPSKYVNALFTTLVSACVPHASIDISKLPKKIQELRLKLIKLCGEAEGYMESHYSAILSSFEGNPLDHLDIFPYYTNYLKLSRLEYTILSQNFPNFLPTQIAFIGSGPLPLTSIVLASKHLTNTTFHNYDICPSANTLATRLVSADSDLSRRMFFHTVDIMNVTTPLKQYDVVFLAALVGMTKEDKIRVLDHLAKYMASDAVLMLRSAHDARAFLYPIVDPRDLRGFKVVEVFHPTDEVINSVVIAQKLSSLSYVDRKHGVGSMMNKCGEIQGFNPFKQKNMMEELVVDEKNLSK